MDVMIYLIYITVILILGFFMIYLSRKTSIPSPLLLLTLGVILGTVKIKGYNLIFFSENDIIPLLIFFAIILLFDKISHLKVRELDSLTNRVIPFFLTFFVLNLVFLTVAARFLINKNQFFYALIFSAILGAIEISPFYYNHRFSKKINSILNFESVLSLSLSVIIGFCAYAFIMMNENSIFMLIQGLILKIMISVGIGIFFAIIIMNLRKRFHKIKNMITFIITALLAYYSTELIQGIGMISVLVFGLFVANTRMKKSEGLNLKFSHSFFDVAEILSFTLLGIIITIRFDIKILMISMILYLILLMIRFFSVIIFFNKALNLKEQFYLTFNTPNGAMSAILIVILLGSTAFSTILLLCIVYSIIISTITIRYLNKKDILSEE